MKEIPPKINFELAASSPPWKGRTRLVFKDLAKGNIQSVLIRPALMVVVWVHASLEVSVSTGNPNKSSMFPGIFHYKPSISWGTPMTMETSVSIQQDMSHVADEHSDQPGGGWRVEFVGGSWSNSHDFPTSIFREFPARELITGIQPGLLNELVELSTWII